MREGTCFERRSSSIVAAELDQVSRQKRGKKVATWKSGNGPSSASIEKKSRYCLDRGDVTFFFSLLYQSNRHNLPCLYCHVGKSIPLNDATLFRLLGVQL